MLKSERLILRPVTIHDCEDIYEYSKNPNVGYRAGWKPHESKKETAAIMKMIFIGQDHIFGIIIKSNNKLVGTIGLIHDPKRENKNAWMLGYALHEAYWGKGIMTEAAKLVIQYAKEQPNITLISAYCYPYNPQSRRVLEKCGFEYEGLLRQAEVLYTGEIVDNLCFSMIIK